MSDSKQTPVNVARPQTKPAVGSDLPGAPEPPVVIPSASSSASSASPSLLSRMKRLVTSHRKVRRLDSDPLKQDLLSSGHAVSYIRHLVRGNEIKVRRFGEQSPDRHPPVLLIHGFMGTRGSMVASRAASGRRCWPRSSSSTPAAASRIGSAWP